MDKKTVKFEKFLGWRDHPTGAVQALLGNIKGHYRLGDEANVITSAVLRIVYDKAHSPMEIETLNTIYIREGAYE